MKESYWGYYLILLGIMVSTVMIMMSNMTTTNQQDYYLLKEVTSAAMRDAVDYNYYLAHGEIKVNTEKFLENFLRRFAQNISKNNTYKIDFYSIYENPPSVSIKVTSNTGDFTIAGNSTNFDVVNTIDAVLEADNSVHFDKVFYSIPYASCTDENDTIDDDGYCKLRTQAMFNQMDYYKDIVNSIKAKISTSEFQECKIRVLNSEFLRKMDTAADISAYGAQFSSTYDYKSNVGDIPDLNDGRLHLVPNLKDVKFTIADDEDGNKILSWTAKYNCGDESIGLKSGDIVKKFRLNTDDLQKKILAAQDSHNTTLEKKLIDDYNSNYSQSSSYIDDSEYNNLSADDKKKYELTPYYGSCLVGIVYRIDFYYDVNYSC